MNPSSHCESKSVTWVNKSKYFSKPYIPILLNVCSNASMKNVIKFVKLVKLLNVKFLIQF